MTNKGLWLGRILGGIIVGLGIGIGVFAANYFFSPNRYDYATAGFSSPHIMTIQGEKERVRYDIDFHFGSDERAYSVMYDDNFLWFTTKVLPLKFPEQEPITKVLMKDRDLIVFATATEGLGAFTKINRPTRGYQPHGEPNSPYYDNYLFEIAEELLPQIHRAIRQSFENDQ